MANMPPECADDRTFQYVQLRGSMNMNPIAIETFGIFLILAYAVMCLLFLLQQRQGKGFVESFDKALMWGGGLFILSYSLNTAAYMAMT